MSRILAAAGAAALLLLSGCGPGGNGIDPAKDQIEAAQQQKNCADPQWKAAHLGVWYTVCRPNDALGQPH